MRLNVRTLFPYVAAVLALGAVGYAVSFGTLPPADFTFVNGTEIQSIDPAIVTGSPEGRIISALFEGLLASDPRTLEPIPAVAERYELSQDRKTYTFHLRPSCRWSDGKPVTAHDFKWSWLRFLHPETAAQYAYQLYYYVENADQYSAGRVEIGDPVEVELDNRPPHATGRGQLFPRGTVLRGKLIAIEKPPAPTLPKLASDDEQREAQAQWKREWTYDVQIDGRRRRFSTQKAPGRERCKYVLFDFEHVGIEAAGDHELRVTLKNPTPYFLHLMAFYPMYPVQRACIERHGTPDWTRAGNIVSNGPYLLEFRRIRDRIRLVKNPRYWNADQVALEVIDALAVNSETTGLNMYMNGQVDWVSTVPSSVTPILMERDDFYTAPMLTTYFYRLNVTRPPLDNPLVRQALNLAIDKQQICDSILRAGQVPARSLVPPGLKDYRQASCGEFDPEAARKLLAEAGYPGGKGLSTITLLYNTSEGHRTIAERIQSDWKKNLGVDVALKNQEWGVFLDSVHEMEFTVARAAWIGDYPDPNTFLDMFVTAGPNNETGWSSPRYDELIREATVISDPAQRLEKLHEAESILMRELPIIPIYFYVSKNMVRSDVEGFYTNIQDLHPLHNLRLKPKDSSPRTSVLNTP